MNNHKGHNLMENENGDIIIIGAGLTGMITALSYASAGKKVILIDTNKPDYKLPSEAVNLIEDNRTTALTAHSLQFLNSIFNNEGKLALLDCLGVIKNIYVLDNKKSNKMLHFEETDKVEALGYIIINAEFKKILLQQIRYNNFIKFIEKQDIVKLQFFTSDFYNTTVHCPHNYYTATLVVLCCGISSALFKQYFSASLFKKYPQSALTFNVIHEKDHENCAVEHFMPTCPFAILPLKNQFSSSIVWAMDSKVSKILKSMEKKEFEFYVQRNFGEFLGKISLANHICEFPLIAYMARNYYYKNLVLVGDSAHIIHPLAGQGLNLGIKDIESLVKLTKNTTITQNLLQEYQDLRITDNEAMYFITDNLNRIFSNDNNLLSEIRTNGLLLINNIQFAKKQILDYASGIR